MAALAAMAGKAMMTSMLALMLAAAGALRNGASSGNGGGGGGEKCSPQYITAHGRNLEMHQVLQKPVEVAGTFYRSVLDREP